MTQSRDDLCLLLLDLLAEREVAIPRIETLDHEDWKRLLTIAKQHRVTPLVSRTLSHSKYKSMIPSHVMDHLREVEKTLTLRDLAARMCQFRLATLLDDNGMPYALLKGAYLSQHIYPTPVLRPMRDIDVLVEKDTAIGFFERLEGLGYCRRQNDVTPMEFALEHRHHLPPLICPVSNYVIEIHTKLFPPGQTLTPQHPLADIERLLSRRVSYGVATHKLHYLNPTDTLLHLIVHATYQHGFDSGPLILTDINFLLQNASIDWPYFWEQAHRGDWIRGCHLIFAICAEYYEIDIRAQTSIKTSPQDIIAASTIRDATLLSLQDMNDRKSVRFHAALKAQINSRSALQNILKTAIPKKHVLAEYAGVPLTDKFLWANYPRWLIEKTKDRFLTKTKTHHTDNINRLTSIEAWLKSEG